MTKHASLSTYLQISSRSQVVALTSTWKATVTTVPVHSQLRLVKATHTTRPTRIIDTCYIQAKVLAARLIAKMAEAWAHPKDLGHQWWALESHLTQFLELVVDDHLKRPGVSVLECHLLASQEAHLVTALQPQHQLVKCQWCRIW